jgi:toxin-antitoxin system PIN domain toxin
VIFVDANLLLYAYDADHERHAAARAWLEGSLGGDQAIRIPLVCALAFVRIGTNPSAFRVPLDPAEAVRIVESWLDRPGVEIGVPTDRHWATLRRLVRDGQARGPLTMDAHIAALTMEHGATLCTTDRDFARFPGLRFTNPIAAGAA